MTKVLIVDDHPIFRDGLAGLLATLPEIEITGTVGTASEALTAIKHNPPDVVLMDIRLPDGVSGVEATRQAIEAAPATAILVITMVDDDDTVMAALAAGARGYILKEASGDEIAAALRAVAAGGAVFGAGIATRLLATTPAQRPASALPPLEDLTERERQVLQLLAGGASNRHIVRDLGVSLKTVQNHVSRILDKLQATDRTQAALRARGIAPPPPR